MDDDRSDDWYVDDRCTNCDVARQLAPGLIEQVGGRSQVVRQPRDTDELARMNAAAFACHTRSIRRPDRPLDTAADPYPLALDENVLFCGHNSRNTAAANAYLLRRPDGTQMMVDTPRWSAALADRYEASGRVTDVLLTHRDHAAHGRQYADRFGARLWIHEGDLGAARDADQVLRGIEPTEIAEGVVAHPLAGHTEGSVLFVADERYCFSGDSLYWSRAKGSLAVAEHVTWYSIRELAASLTRTAPSLRFSWVLPGHGDRKHLPAEEMAEQLRALTAYTRQLRPTPVDFAAHQW
ncbi:MBL fold metallo-hydrolase [Streptacidiphilus fuscans]|uniref:MBL fold metallo-hydrolase n=1 Tax=Streptacidiphilus fuscans TaxID=2789292 RepID=A0A931FC67_9ACTN|nr:MBL fold metallo-hydrolase [Streptacidiphilus fuscans]MBF9066860.1 MBL fold metallo-hydrolase [Streptacidiphilus fuscans]